MTQHKIACFDGHNDILLKIWLRKDCSPKLFIHGFDDAHIDLKKAQKGQLMGGLCAIFPPPISMELDKNGEFLTLPHEDAFKSTMAMLDLLEAIEKAAPNAFKICKNSYDIENSLKEKKFAAVFHIEGVEAVSKNLDELYMFHEKGLRSLGPVWSRPNIFAHGVPFRFPSSPNIGDGLSDYGKDLIKACNELRINIDLSHMNEKGFFDIAKISQAPLVASHSNAHHLCPSSRNLTDNQLLAIKESQGLVGVNFGVGFLRRDGIKNPDTPLKIIIEHMAYMVDKMGIDHVALGSDFDGTTVPNDLKDCSDLPNLIHAMQDFGFHTKEIQKIACDNWLNLLKRVWGH